MVIFYSKLLVYQRIHIYIHYLIGGLEHGFYFSIQLRMSSSQLTFTPSFFRGVAKNHQPDNHYILTII